MVDNYTQNKRSSKVIDKCPYDAVDSAEVMEYKKTHPKLTLNEIVERETFQRLFRKMNRSMVRWL